MPKRCGVRPRQFILNSIKISLNCQKEFRYLPVIYQRGSLKKHEAIKRHILSNLSVIGVDTTRVLHIDTELAIVRKKRPIAQPDIVIEYAENDTIRKLFVEIKSGSCKRAVQNLHYQLRKLERFLERQHINGEVLGIYYRGNVINFVTASESAS